MAKHKGKILEGHEGSIFDLYESLKNSAGKELLTLTVPKIIQEIDSISRAFLKEQEIVPLKSIRIPGKEYFVFHSSKDKYTRPINKAIFDLFLPEKYTANYANNNFGGMKKEQISTTLYTVSMSFCAAIDLLRERDKKTPATFFEKFIGNIFARELGVQPVNALPMLDDKKKLATDYIFKTEKGKANIHLQIKLSTRERAIEAWAHQRIIEGMYGKAYRGILAVMSETNAKLNNMSLTEVCVPKQWGLYQEYIATIHRIYYLDPPTRTEELHLSPPYIQVKSLSEFFLEKESVLHPSGE